MLSTNAALAVTNVPPPMPEMPAADAPIAVDSRFGTIVVASEARLTFPQGLLGFSDYHMFGVASLPSVRVGFCGDPRAQLSLCVECSLSPRQ